MSLDLGTLITTLGVDMSQLGVAEVRLKALDATAGSTFNSASSGASNLTGQMLKLAAAAAAVYESYRLISSAVSYGMRVETLGVAMNVVAKNAGLSADAVKYFAMQVKGAGVTSEESFAVITRAMTQGLDLNKMKELATRARDIAVVAGKNTSETFATLMHGIASGRSIIFHNLNLATRDQKAVFDEYAASLGKTADQLNMVERRMAMLNEVMRASAGFAGAAAAADETAGKQLASLDRVVKDTYESFWALFGPGVSEGIKQTTLAFKDLQYWAEANNTSMTHVGESIGRFVANSAQAAISASQWALANSELLKGLAELYIAYKAVTWIQGLAVVMSSSQTAATLLQGAIAALQITLGTTAYTTTTLAANFWGATTATTAFTSAGIALNAAMTPLLATLIPIAAALAVIGAYKGLTGKAGYLGPAESALEPGVGLEQTMGIGTKKVSEFEGYEEPKPTSWRIWDSRAKSEAEATAANLKALKDAPVPLDKGKGAKSQEAAEKSVRSFIETMNQAVAAGAGDTEAVLQAWKSKQLQTLAELATKGADITQAKLALNEAVAAKQRRLDEDFNNWYITGMGRQYAALQANENKKLKEVQGNAEKTAKVYEVFALKRKELDDQVNTNTMNLFKGYLDTMASLTPTLEGQANLKRQSLELEIQLSKAALERQIRQEQINPELADQARSMEALVAQAKRFNLEMSQNRGLEGWAYQRLKSEQGKNTWADFMEGSESFIADAFSQGIQGALTQTNKSFQQVAADMAQSFILNMAKRGIHEAFTGIASLIIPGFGQMGKPDGSPGRPFSVMVVGGVGGGGIPSGFAAIGDQLMDVFNGGAMGLEGASSMLEVMFDGSILGLTSASGSWGGMFGNAISGLLGVLGGGGGGGGGGGFLGILGGVASFALGLFGLSKGGILGGSYLPIQSFAQGAPRVSAPTLAWVGEGPNEEAVIPLQQGSVPVKLMGGREQGPQLVYAPTVHVGDGVDRDDKEWFKKELRRQKAEIYDTLRKGNRNFVRMR